jgi:outer membrane receptor protein involved in Fe transport
MDWAVTDNFRLLASVGYNDNEFDETIRIPGAIEDLVTAGHTIAGAPWTTTIGGSYEGYVAARPFYVRADYNYRAENDGLTRQTDPSSASSYDPLQRPSPSMTDVRLRAGVQLTESIELAVFVNNLLDETPMLYRDRPSSSGFDFEFTAVRPRTFGVSAIFNF